MLLPESQLLARTWSIIGPQLLGEVLCVTGGRRPGASRQGEAAWDKAAGEPAKRVMLTEEVTSPNGPTERTLWAPYPTPGSRTSSVYPTSLHTFLLWQPQPCLYRLQLCPQGKVLCVGGRWWECLLPAVTVEEQLGNVPRLSCPRDSWVPGSSTLVEALHVGSSRTGRAGRDCSSQ